MKSVGDFYVNIIPKLDQIALNTGITAVNATMDMASKAWNLGKKGWRFFDETSQVTADIVRFADSLKLPIERVQVLQNAFTMAGLSADGANSAILSLMQSYSSQKLWGEADWSKLSRAGLAKSLFTGDPLKDILNINKAISQMDTAQALSAIQAVGLGTDALKVLRLDPQSFADLLSKSGKLVISGVDARANLAYQKELLALNLTMDKFQAELVSKVLPELSSLLGKVNMLLTDEDFTNAIKDLTVTMAQLAESTVDLLAWLGVKSADPKTMAGFKPYGSPEDLGGGWTLQEYRGRVRDVVPRDVNVRVTAGDGLKAEIEESGRRAVKDNNGQVIDNSEDEKGAYVQ
jgi:hypothetical protein